MTIDELIEELQRFKQLNGNLNVIFDESVLESLEYSDVESIQLKNYKKSKRLHISQAMSPL